MRTRWVVVCAIAACHRSPAVAPAIPQPGPPVVVDAAPTLAVIAPERGAFVDGGPLAVTGRVSDDGAVRVVVNGVEAALASDGSFTATVPVAPGIAIVETHAIDTAGHDVRDARAVLAGADAPSDGSARAPVGVQLGRGGLATVAASLGASLGAVDFAAMARTLNPIYDDDGCLGARVDIAGLTIGKVGLTLTPMPGAIDTAVTVNEVVLRLDVHYEVACIGGHTTTTVRTNLRARGDLRAALVDGHIHTAFAPRVALDDFQIDTAGIPDRIESLVRGPIRSSVERALTNVIANQVPPLADARLAVMLARPPSPAVLGRDVKLELVPRELALSASGVFVVAEAALAVAEGQRGRYVPAPAAITARDRVDSGAWIAADTVNQLLAGLWAAHAFDRTLSIDDVGPVALFLGSEVRTIELRPALPPMVRGAELAIGELGITTRDASGVELQRFAVSLRGALAFEAGELPVVTAQLLAERAGLARALDGNAVEGIAKTAWSLALGALGGGLVGTPLGGTAFAIRAVTARDNMLVFDLSP